MCEIHAERKTAIKLWWYRPESRGAVACRWCMRWGEAFINDREDYSSVLRQLLPLLSLFPLPLFSPPKVGINHPQPPLAETLPRHFSLVVFFWMFIDLNFSFPPLAERLLVLTLKCDPLWLPVSATKLESQILRFFTNMIDRRQKFDVVRNT